jgi:hypothetical protein
MTGLLRRGVAVGVLGVLAALPCALTPYSPSAAAAPPQTTDVVVDTENPGGEPQVAVNPRDPKNIVVGENVSGVTYSRDGGATWTPVSVPNLGDNVLGVLPNGTFLFSSFDGKVYASSDGGRTWPKVGNWVGGVADTLYSTFPDIGYPGSAAYGQVMRNVACNAPAFAGLGPVGTGPDDPGLQLLGCDRPWMAVDPHTGRVYLSFAVHGDASGGGLKPELDAAALLNPVACRANNGSVPFACGRQYVSASGDGGRTWSTFKPMDSSDYPAAGTQGWSGGPVASFGMLATAYSAHAPGCADTCLVFETSRDDGATWTRRIVGPVAFAPAANGQSTSQNFSPYVAADPSRRGRYAVLSFDAGQKNVIVDVTQDWGRSWKRVTLREPGGGVQRWTPWIEYSPLGVLGASWRTSYADGTFDSWAAISRGGDTRFEAPVKLSSARSPGPVATGGDDASDLAMTKTTLYAVWGDQRGGPAPTGWFGSSFNRLGSYTFAGGGAGGARTPVAPGSAPSRPGDGLAATGGTLAPIALALLLAALGVRRLRRTG